MAAVPEPALLSPLTVQIKASGGRKKGWTEQEEEEIHMSASLIYVTGREGGRPRGAVERHVTTFTPGQPTVTCNRLRTGSLLPKI